MGENGGEYAREIVIEYARKIERGEERESKRRYERVGENEREWERMRESERE